MDTRARVLLTPNASVALGFTMAVSYVLMNVELGSEEKVLEEIRKLPYVKECHRLYGVYDMIAKVEADSMDELKQAITWKIRRLPGVRSTITTIAIE